MSHFASASLTSQSEIRHWAHLFQ